MSDAPNSGATAASVVPEVACCLRVRPALRRPLLPVGRCLPVLPRQNFGQWFAGFLASCSSAFACGCCARCSSRSRPRTSRSCPWRVGFSALNIARISLSMALMVSCSQSGDRSGPRSVVAAGREPLLFLVLSPDTCHRWRDSSTRQASGQRCLLWRGCAWIVTARASTRSASLRLGWLTLRFRSVAIGAFLNMP